MGTCSVQLMRPIDALARRTGYTIAYLVTMLLTVVVLAGLWLAAEMVAELVFGFESFGIELND